jgi:homoserine O-acetyltransferase/O-succinyltransferase
VTANTIDVALPNLALERGGVVTDHRARVWFTQGPAHAERHGIQAVDPSLPTVLVVHALTGDANAGGERGWWSPLIGLKRALDTDKYQVLCINNLGTPYGSSGPSRPGFPLAATLTSVDQARAIAQTLDVFRLERLELVTGGSLGGMVALSLAALRPQLVKRLAVFAAPAQSSAWVQGFNHVQRQAIRSDAMHGLSLARQIAMLTYRAEAGLQQRQSRDRTPAKGWTFPIQSYLQHQGEKLSGRFTAEAYLAQLDVMDTYDLLSSSVGIKDITAASLVVDIDSDQLFTTAQVEVLAATLRENGRYVERGTIKSLHGHDAFLIEFEQVATLLQQALAMPE